MKMTIIVLSVKDDYLSDDESIVDNDDEEAESQLEPSQQLYIQQLQTSSDTIMVGQKNRVEIDETKHIALDISIITLR